MALSRSCWFYKKMGHKKVDCHKYKAWLTKNESGGNPFTFVCFESNLIDVPLNIWCFDFGAVVHVANTLKRFKSQRKPK